MKIKDLLKELDDIAPFKDSEDWDNTGLLVGDMEDEVTGILTALDCSIDTVSEAVESGLNTIISHHPLIFPKITEVTEDFYGKIIRKLIKNDINLITMHTNLDHQPNGVSHMIAEALGFSETEILLPKKYELKKLRVNIPAEDKEALKEGLSKGGVGNQGDYSECFFEYPITGQFRPNENANPHIGTNNELEIVDEYVVEAIFESHEQDKVIEALLKVHPYEEPAFDIFTINNVPNKGLGVKIDYEGSLESLVALLEEKTGASIVNVVKGNDEKIMTAGIIGGSGMSYATDAFRRGIDVLITGDVKYHEAYDAKLQGRNIIDAGHSLESFMAEGLRDLLRRKVDTKAEASSVNTDPFQKRK
ncbi:Nif3-like dinuclear metal center hexameric protein [Lacicoccus alkaliphilus]|uniref:GTP cyclohydrolase 1 type 2 homolog n=1 Tax=Lacicoccus alkaliphilus DSM 16010 TaxID=1123231 RepID=A0A1M7BK60_9BACL|nr:Nif3-like dinuclear metal center hexameric protein [Salinicoccus alkaliphilus]SHL55425.1 dinuclear metal center protein, YbgI/SA1388 family [Salinicoccus alkaliphilus DSM 16010]